MLAPPMVALFGQKKAVVDVEYPSKGISTKQFLCDWMVDALYNVRSSDRIVNGQKLNGGPRAFRKALC